MLRQPIIANYDTHTHIQNYIGKQIVVVISVLVGSWPGDSVNHAVYYRPQCSCGKVMFSQASVILFIGGVYPSMH